MGTLTSWNPLSHSRPVTGLFLQSLVSMYYVKQLPVSKLQYVEQLLGYLIIFFFNYSVHTASKSSVSVSTDLGRMYESRS